MKRFWLARMESNHRQQLYKNCPITTWVLANVVAEARIERAIFRLWTERDTFSPLRCIAGLTNPHELLIVSNLRSILTLSEVYSSVNNNHPRTPVVVNFAEWTWENLLTHIRLRFQNYHTMYLQTARDFRSLNKYERGRYLLIYGSQRFLIPTASLFSIRQVKWLSDKR